MGRDISNYFKQSFGALIFDSRNEYSEMIKAMSKQLINEPNSHGFNNRGVAYKEIGDYKKAEMDFVKAIEIDSSNEMAAFHLNRLKTNNH